MNTKIHRIFLCVIFGLVLVISSCKSNISTQTIHPISTSTISIETLRADPNYIAGCKKINPNSVNVQAGYKGIYPGRTTKNEAENLLGRPLRINELNETSWEYSNLDIVFDGSVVSILFVAGDDTTTLKGLILQYGCPDEIYALDMNEHPYGEYSRLLFLYHHIGFAFTIDNIPAGLNNKVYEMSYFMPGTLEDYEKLFLWFNIPNKTKPMNWNDAVHQ